MNNFLTETFERRCRNICTPLTPYAKSEFNFAPHPKSLIKSSFDDY